MPDFRLGAGAWARRPRFVKAAALLAGWIAMLGAGATFASGWPPFASDDSASVKRGASVSRLDSGAPSVLDNDFDLEGDPMVAVLTRQPRYGELEFNNDGTFLYRHDGRSEKDDEFRYRAFDGTSYSREAKVEIEILPGDPIPPQIVDQNDVSVEEDGFVDISLEDLVVVDPDSSYPRDFTLEVRDGDNYTRSGERVSPTADFNGTLFVPVRVFDGSAYSNLFDLNVEVSSVNDPPYVVMPIPDQEAVEGQNFALSLADHFGDVDSYEELRYAVSGLPGSGSLTVNSQSGVLSGTPVLADARDEPYSITAAAIDTDGQDARLSFRLTIRREDRADLAVVARILANPVLVGETAAWQIDIENRGPADLEEGELVGSWTTAGAAMSLSVPADCLVDGDGTPQPTLRCALPRLSPGSTLSIPVQGLQSEAGDNTLSATAVADDPVPGNNSAAVSAQVAGAFSAGPAQVLARSGSDIAVGDLDADGRVDLVVSGAELTVHFNTGDRRLEATGVVIGSGGSRVSLLDWNGDGIVDIAVAGPAASNASIYLGSSAGAFESPVSIDTGSGGDVVAIAAADVDQDGRDEALIAGSFGIRLARYADGNASAVESVMTTPVRDVGIADVNSDSYPDIASIRQDSGELNILANAGDGSFAAAGSYDVGAATCVTAEDLDRDGAADLVVAVGGGATTAPHTRMLMGDGSGTFQFGTALGASTASDLLTGDLSGDGVIDVVVVNATGVHQIYLGAAADYVLDAEQVVSYESRRGVVADINGDGSLDLMLSGEQVAGVELHANNGRGLLGPGDTEAPELTLQGDAVMEIPAGAEFVDPGATAVDDIDGDLTASIVISGTINTTVVGTQLITYTVSDRAANTSSVTRTIKVGVNAGTGGSGGGALSVATLVALLLLYCATNVVGRPFVTGESRTIRRRSVIGT